MNRLKDFGRTLNKATDHIEAHVIENTFHYMMQGRKKEYMNEVANSIKNLLGTETKRTISVAQLSMVDSAEMVERETGREIGNPLRTLVDDVKAKVSSG